MIYLGLITERVPIVGSFVPSHATLTSARMPFGEIFDMERLSAAIHSPVLEWKDVKDPKSESLEVVGCWSPWATTSPDGKPRGNGNAVDAGLGE